jgi:hypothetical protein
MTAPLVSWTIHLVELFYIATNWWFTPVFSTNKTDGHDIAEILLKVALNTINHNHKMVPQGGWSNLQNV